ncbi:MAG: chromosome segregation protein SMC [Acidimicrobiia bacterium]|nr:MAG: chromosome segregation protein SMC [Acidimicrobiia bacterium]
MKLKHLTLRGFKSFADRTRLDFTSGVNVVVGPNGSGKSNILDAIAWVMGTQATKSLRTERMEDVVFAGTETRPPLPRAEVSLTFANDDQLIPLGLAEITITRRLFRDGTSEYELNGAPCRLLDIQDLLSDGGIGKQQHVLVGQGQVGDILNASPEDHRAVIEEAAGVTKHRSRRERSVRRLERTDLDVERLNDILMQQRKALRPLKRQANAALRYDSVKDEAMALRLWLGGEQLRALRTRIEQAKAERSDAAAKLDASDSELKELRDGLEGLRTAAGHVGAELRRDTAAAARLETVRERFTSASLVARERSQAITSRLVGADERRDDLETELHDLKDVLANSSDVERKAIDEVERRDTALRALEDEERALAEQVQLPTEGVVANLRGDLRSLETAANRDRIEAEQIEQRMLVVADRVSDETEEADRLNREIRDSDSSVTVLAKKYEISKVSRESAETAFSLAQAAKEEALLAVTRSQARVDALEAALEGLVDDVALTIATGYDGVLGAVVAHLDVPARYGPAVDAALGSWRSAFVTLGPDPMRNAINALKTAGTGGVSFVFHREGDLSVAQRAADRFGVDTLVGMLGKNADSALAAAFLGDVVVVEGWNTAWEIVEVFPDVRVVTPEGDVVTQTGMIVSQPDGAGPAALEGSKVELEVAERDLSRTSSLATATGRSFEAAKTEERQALDLLENLEAKLGGLSEALGLNARSLAASNEESERLASRIAAIADSAQIRDDRISALRDRVAGFEGEEAARHVAWEALNVRRGEVAAQREQAQRILQEASGDVAVIVERRTMSEARLAAVEAELNQLQWLPGSDETVHSLTRIDEVAQVAISTVSGFIEELRERQRSLRDRSGSTNAELVDAEARREALETTSRTSSAMVNALDVELAELNVRDEAACEAIRRDADATEAQALSAVEPDIGEDVDPEHRLESLTADLRRMGPINPLAAAEYEELASASQELEEQLADLAESRGELKKVIAALDEKMVALFEEAFADIAKYYEENFALVFPGGKGQLRLDKGTDPLATGVLVQAQPAGKKVGRLSLLSGGERSLAALAFLFAVFRARPSPFYVLDEVEAALDDANLHRFLRLVHTLRESVQLVIITHQQQTMEAADVLYGVTMEPGESSKVLSKRMTSVSV